MKPILVPLTALLAALLLSGCSDSEIDLSSKEAARASFENVKDSLNEKSEELIGQANDAIVESKDRAQEMADLGHEKIDAAKETATEVMDSTSGETIIDKAIAVVRGLAPGEKAE
jgi:PBP1b-binding outer membrane lipoprotein LpoB